MWNIYALCWIWDACGCDNLRVGFPCSALRDHRCPVHSLLWTLVAWRIWASQQMIFVPAPATLSCDVYDIRETCAQTSVRLLRINLHGETLIYHNKHSGHRSRDSIFTAPTHVETAYPLRHSRLKSGSVQVHHNTHTRGIVYGTFESLPLPALVFTHTQWLLITLYMDVPKYASLCLFNKSFKR
jgi:hypothetical protein